MLQAALTNLLIASLILIFFGLFAFGWLVVHVEHSRHRSTAKIALALILGAVLIGFGLHFFLIASGI
jgi:TRAP-type C4-dicarboxylate transport system permease small subunit